MTTTSPEAAIPVVYASRIDPNEGAEARLAHAHRENGRITTELLRVREELRLLKDEMNVVADIGEKDVNTICDLRAELDKAHADRDAALRAVSSFVADDPLGAQSDRVNAENAALRTEIAKLKLSCATDWKGQFDNERKARSHDIEMCRLGYEELKAKHDEALVLLSTRVEAKRLDDAMEQLQSHGKRWARVRELAGFVTSDEVYDKEDRHLGTYDCGWRDSLKRITTLFADILSSEPEAVAADATHEQVAFAKEHAMTQQSHLPIPDEVWPHGSVSNVEACVQVPTLGIKLLSPHATMPTRAHSTDSGADAYASEATTVTGLATVVQLGIACVIPTGHELQIRPRSSMSKRGIHCALDTIDQGYVGPIAAVMWTSDGAEKRIQRGEKVCQLVLAPVAYPSIVAVDSLPDTERGESGWGSTDKTTNPA